MDLSWCIICDRHCVGNNLYCSESCRFQDCSNDNCYDKKTTMPKSPEIKLSKLVSPPASPVPAPFLFSFESNRSYDYRHSSPVAGNMIHVSHNSTSAHTNYQYFPYRSSTPGSFSGSSFFADDT